MAFESTSIERVEKFLEWTICQKVGKKGRKKRGTKSSGTLNTRWKNLAIVYKVAMKKKFEPQIYHDIVEVGRLSLEGSRSYTNGCRFNNA
jgi:hypothetical protein